MILKFFDLHSTSNLREGNRNKNDFWSTAWTSCCHAVNSNFKDPGKLKKKKKLITSHQNLGLILIQTLRKFSA